VDNVIAVAASTASDDLLDSRPFADLASNFGAKTVDLAAPGRSILSTSPDNSQAEDSGTSYAAAYVSGGAALLMAQFPHLTHRGIRTLLLGSVDLKPAFSGITVTGGRLNVFTPLNPANGGQPVVANPGNQTNDEGDTVSLQIEAIDPDDPPLPFTYTATGLPDSDDLSIDSETGLISGNIGSGAAGVYEVEVTVTDDESLFTSVSFTWTVNNNLAPLVTNPGDQTNNEGDTVSLQIVASANDPADDPLTYTATGLPDPDDLSIDPVTGLISGSLDFNSAGVYPVEVTVTDNGIPNLSTSVSFTWTVNGDADPPTPPSTVTIDIIPGKYPNIICLGNKCPGKHKKDVDVALLTTDEYDAADVNEMSVEFEGASPKRCKLKDVDHNHDKDLLCKFKVKDIVGLDESSTEGTLTGEMADGTPIMGTDSVCVISHKGKKGKKKCKPKKK
jgi:hypothetical protein